MKWIKLWQFTHERFRSLGLSLAVGLMPFQVEAQPPDRGSITLSRPNQPARSGILVGTPTKNLQFQSVEFRDLIPLETGDALGFPPVVSESSAPQPPFQLLSGECMRLSGSLKELSASTIRLTIPGMDREVEVRRAACQAIVQVPGESRILTDGFEGLDTARWSIKGTPAIVDSKHFGGQKSLRIGVGDHSILHTLEEPLVAGRIDLAFDDSAKLLPDRRCGIELSFRGPSGLKPLRVDLGWNEESLTVESPGGPALAVQRLARAPGWHRLSIQFRANSTEISVDGQELANGKGPIGPLTSIRIGSPSGSKTVGKPTADEAAFTFDELQVTRFAEPPQSIEIDPSQDEARLVSGDQLFGSEALASFDDVELTVAGRRVKLPWREVSGLYLRRMPLQGSSVEGLLVRAEWFTRGGSKTQELDFAEGALLEFSPSAISLRTPYAGVLQIPRGRLRSLIVRGHGRRITFDTSSHHLGESISVDPPMLDPPLAEGSSLERTIELEAPIDGPSFLSLDVLQVVGEAPGLPFSELIRDGELRTYVAIDGKRVDYLNRHIKTRNETVERIRIPIPPGMLGRGQHKIRIEQTASAEDPTGFDDLGIVQMALEIDSGSGNATSTEKP